MNTAADLLATFSVRDGAVTDVQLSLMASDLLFEEGGHDNGRTVIRVRRGTTWSSAEQARHRLCEIHHSFGADMRGIKTPQRRAGALGMAVVLTSLFR